jgi:hypothetical protein
MNISKRAAYLLKTTSQRVNLKLHSQLSGCEMNDKTRWTFGYEVLKLVGVQQESSTESSEDQGGI